MLAEFSLPLGLGLSYAALAITPGSNFLLVTQLSLAAPRTSALSSALGIATGAFALAIVGLSSGRLLTQFSPLFWLINVGFSGVLLYFGISLLRATARPRNANSMVAPGCRQCFRVGIATAFMNPLTLAFFLGSATTLEYVAGSLAILENAIVVFAIAFAWFSFLALCFSARTVRQVYLMLRPWIDGSIGTFFVVLGLKAAMGLGERAAVFLPVN